MPIVDRIFKRLRTRYVYVNFTPSYTVENTKDNPVHVRVFRYEMNNGKKSSDPWDWGVTKVEEAELVEGMKYTFKLKLVLPEDVKRYEVGVVHERLRWIEREWVDA